MAQHALWENYKVIKITVPIAVTASANSTGVDMLGLKKDVLVLVNVGAVSGTTPTLAVAIQTSPDNVTFTTQATISLVAGSANKFASAKVRVPVSHRYIRVAETIAGTDTPTFLRSIMALVKAERGDDALNSATPV